MLVAGASLSIVLILGFAGLKLAQILSALTVMERISEADSVLRRYEAAYAGAVSLAADHFRISGKSVERRLMQIYSILKQKRELIDDCKGVPASDFFRKDVRSAVLSELEASFRRDGEVIWQIRIDNFMHDIVQYFSCRLQNLGRSNDWILERSTNPLYSGLAPYFNLPFGNLDAEPTVPLEQRRRA